MRRFLRGRPRSRRRIGRLLFFAPALVFIVIFVAYPVIATVLLSFVSETSGEFPTLRNYESILTDTKTLDPSRFPGSSPPWGTLVHNGFWIVIHLPLTLFTGLALALVLRDVKGASLVKSVVFIGMVTPMIVGGVVLRYLYEGGVGVVPAFFGLIGVDSLDRNWMAFTPTALFGLIFGSVWLWTGFSLIVYSAGLTTIPKEYFEAAKIDGASSLRTFMKITWPLLRPITLIIVTLTVLWELKIFDIVFAVAGAVGGFGGAADVLALQMYREAFLNLSFEKGAVVASLLTALTLLSTVWLIRRLAAR